MDCDPTVKLSNPPLVLPEIVLLTTIKLPGLLNTPAPVLPEMVLFLMVSAPLFCTPPNQDPPLSVTP